MRMTEIKRNGNGSILFKCTTVDVLLQNKLRY